MRTMRVLLATVLGSAALVAAGCGGGGSMSSGSGSDPLSSASLAPKDATAWVSIDTDQGSDQWQALDATLKKIPGAEKAIDDPTSSPVSGVPFRSEVLPAVGKELVLVVPAGGSNPILLVKPGDRGKLDAMLAKTKAHEATGEVGGWTAIASSQKELDAYTAALANGSLSGSAAFATAMQGVPVKALARGYVAGSGLSGLAGQAASVALAAGPGVATGSSGLGPLVGANTLTACLNGAKGQPKVCRSATTSAKSLTARTAVGFAVTTADGLVGFEATVDAQKGQVPAVYTPALLAKVPSDALVAVSFHGGSAITGQLKGAAGAGALAQVEKQLGVSLDDIAATLDGEGVLYVRAGVPIPEITLAVQPSDPARAKATLDKIVAAFGKQAAGSLPINGLELTTATTGDVVIVSTSKSAATSFGTGPKLTETERFKQAASDVGLGDTTAAFLYVDVHGLGPLLKAALGSLGASSGTTVSGLDSLSAIDSVAVNATVDGTKIHVQGAVRVS